MKTQPAQLAPGVYLASAYSYNGALPSENYYGAGNWTSPATPSGPSVFTVPDGGAVNHAIAYPALHEVSGTLTADGVANEEVRLRYYRWDPAVNDWQRFTSADADYRGRHLTPALPDGTYLAVLEFYDPATNIYVERIAGTTADATKVPRESRFPKPPSGPGVFTIAGADQVRNYDWSGTNPAPSATTAPSISATGAVGAAITVTPGTWTETPALGYQWMRNGAAIPGATAASYTPVGADAGQSLTVVVTATQLGNAPGSATTNAAAIAKVKPAIKAAKKVKKNKVKITVTATGLAPSGKITVTAGKVKLGKVTVKDGKATLKLSKKKLAKVTKQIKKGKLTLSLDYSGDTNVLPGKKKVKVTIKTKR